MKKIAFILIMLSCSTAFAQGLPKIAVFMTDNQDASVSRALATELVDALVKSKQYNVIERSDEFIAEINREHTIQRDGSIDDNEIRRLGKRYGAQFVCVVDIRPVLGVFQVSTRIINIETAQVVSTGLAKSQLRTATDFMEASCEVVVDMLGGKPCRTPSTPFSSRGAKPSPAD
jgi:hypothetical protein